MSAASWAAEVDAFVRDFAGRAARWGDHPGDLDERAAIEPWTDPDHPDEQRDGAYRGGIVQPERRRVNDTWPPTEAKATGAAPQATPGTAALAFAGAGKFVFPYRKGQPLTNHGFRDATDDPEQVAAWWQRHPDALIGYWPGGDDIAVLDIDRKNGVDGLATFVALEGCPILPATPTVITPSGGYHLHYRMPAARIGATAGARGRGIGAGLDWRGDSGFAVLPTPGSGYQWGHWTYDNCAPQPVPATLLPREPERPASLKPVKPTTGLSRYAEAALDGACRRILSAAPGAQEPTLNGEAFAIGTLAGAGSIPPDFARRALTWAARQIPTYDQRRPWRAAEIERKVERAFNDGMRHPRGTNHAA